MPVTFSLVETTRSFVAGKAFQRELIGANPGLVEQRRDEAVGQAAVLHAFSDRIDAPVIGLHGVGDDDAALAMDAGLPGQFEVRPDADRHDHQIGRKLRAVGKAHAGDVILAEDRLGLRRHLEHHAALFQRLAQHAAGDRIELTFHQRVEQVHDGDVHAALHQAVGGLEPKQAAADHHRIGAAFRGFHHPVDVVDVAKADHARQVLARQRQHDRIGARRDQQTVIGNAIARLGDDLAGAPVDHDDRLALAQRDAVVLVPLLGVEHDVVDGFFARENRRQQDAIVIAVGLRPEHRDLIEIRRAIEQQFHRADAGHAVADHHQFLLRHFVEHDLSFNSDDTSRRRDARRRRLVAVGSWGSPSAGGDHRQ